jgi:hypothetical protein
MISDVYLYFIRRAPSNVIIFYPKIYERDIHKVIMKDIHRQYPMCTCVQLREQLSSKLHHQYSTCLQIENNYVITPSYLRGQLSCSISFLFGS